MNLQMGKYLKHNTLYDYSKPYLYKGENLKIFSSLLYSEVDSTARVCGEEKYPHEASYKCTFCGKCFGSGEALGGHRRSHVQASKKEFSNYSKEGTTTSVNFNDAGDDDIRYNGEKNHICYVCKKNFPTNNALYGHMRSHPDRVTNLSHENKNCSSNSQSSNSSMENNKEEDQEDGFVKPKGYSDFDLPKLSLHRWKKRGKRGRRFESFELICVCVSVFVLCTVYVSVFMIHRLAARTMTQGWPNSYGGPKQCL